jgi:hypothetical protein
VIAECVNIREILASAGPVHGAAAAHVLAADSDYSLVKELSEKLAGTRPSRFFEKRLQPLTAEAIVVNPSRL